ncbi:uncharacterized protein A4U43_C09F13860 [Asparagus officinalis]|uniref:CG-1 domain-containing protein n=2 Tax=Asparagus officinalis TaxID=4686 RepID=A0A5P1E7G9_ASPOF|nr:uncharacterized protein A4U43_C09F13860 [Asparagus officinalis]
MLCKEARYRWLKPAEIHFVLQNHESYPISAEAPHKPPSGSVFLYNRRVLRYFRKDGHSWRKKKDGRNVGEAHERLKVGNVDALNCYYAHGEPNPYFQRRSYWMLDPAYEHIVLVHYREVSEGRFLSGSISNISANSHSTFNQTTSTSNTHYQGITSGSEHYDPNGCNGSSTTVEEVSSKFALGAADADHLHIRYGHGSRNSDLSPQPEVSLALHKLAMQLSLEDDYENTSCFGEKLPEFSKEYDRSQGVGCFDNTRESFQEADQNLFHGTEFWEQNQIESEKQDGYRSTQSLGDSGTPETNLTSSHNSLGDNGKQGSQPLGSGYSVVRTSPSWNHMMQTSQYSAPINARNKNTLPPEGIIESSMLRPTEHGPTLDIPFEQPGQFVWAQADDVGNNAESRSTRHHIPDSDLSLQLAATREFLLGPENSIESPTYISQLSKVQMQSICDASICETSSDVGKYRTQNSTDWMATIDLDVPNNTYSSDFSTMWFDQGQFGIPLRDDSSLTVAEKQRFSIREICPEWAFSSEPTKVILIGDFLCNSSECSWAIMFGNIQVPAEIVQEGILRCMAPQHGDGKVTICVTSGNRESCSEVREFEFRAKPTTTNFVGTPPKAEGTRNAEEILLLVRLVHILCGSDVFSCKTGSSKETEHFSTLKDESRWSRIMESLLDGSEGPSSILEWVMEELLKDKLQLWLSSKNQGQDCLLSRKEKGFVHLISGLGYEWALSPILDAGVGVNFRDASGWTALHWAARFGRERMVAALLAAGASAGAVTDPTPLDPIGRTAGALAAENGHTGLAAYLSEAALTSHLSSLTMGENEIFKGSAEVEAERAVESISQRTVQLHVGVTEDELSLKDSLAAVRNATQAAARIQAAFRAHSFRKRHQIAASFQDEYGMTPVDIHRFAASSKFQRAPHGSRDHKFDKAALSIQKNYRGWKGRKDFLTLRQHVVKIQAHVRGYRERKKYQFQWTVGVIEKAVLRWRRKGVGLRGYRAEPESVDEGDEEVEEDILKVFRKQKVDAAVDQAVSRVLSMVESPTARQQYRRMLERYAEAKAELGTSDEATSRPNDDFQITESNDLMF